MPSLTDAQFKTRLFDKHGGAIVSLANYQAAKIHSAFKCVTCDHEWTATPDAVLNLGSGCPKCGAEKCRLSQRNAAHKRLLAKCAAKNIRLISSYAGMQERHDFKCGLCNHTWNTAATVVNSGAGCPSCADRPGITLTDYKARVKHIHGNKIVVLSKQYVNARTKLKHRCTLCANEWLAVPYSVGKAATGCQRCGLAGYSALSILWLDYEAGRRGWNIKHAINGGEYRIPGTPYRADGYCEETNTVFEFYGDAIHGNLKKYEIRSKPNLLLPNKTAGELYIKTVYRERCIRKLGYHIVSMWESDYLELLGVNSVYDLKRSGLLKDI